MKYKVGDILSFDISPLVPEVIITKVTLSGNYIMTDVHSKPFYEYKFTSIDVNKIKLVICTDIFRGEI